MLKKILTITAISVTAVAIIIGAYFLIRKAITVITGPGPEAPETEVAITSNVKTLSDRQIFDYWILKNGATGTSTTEAEFSASSQEIYYLTPSGQFFRAAENEDELIASQAIENLQSIHPSHDGSLVLVQYGNILNPQFSILNIKERSWQPLPLNVRAVDFSPDAKQIVILASANGKDDLIIQDLASQPKSRKLISIYQRGLSLKWITKEKIIMLERPSDRSMGSAWEIEVANGNIKSFAPEIASLYMKWSDSGELSLKYSKDGDAPLLSVVNKNNDLISQLTLTLPDKCTISERVIFCAVPKNTTSINKASLLDSYFKNDLFFDDSIFKYEREGSMSTTSTSYRFAGIIATEGVILDISHPQLGSGGLYVLNRLDQKLYLVGL